MVEPYSFSLQFNSELPSTAEKILIYIENKSRHKTDFSFIQKEQSDLGLHYQKIRNFKMPYFDV